VTVPILVGLKQDGSSSSSSLYVFALECADRRSKKKRVIGIQLLASADDVTLLREIKWKRSFRR
jgi:hypothetical protein